MIIGTILMNHDYFFVGTHQYLNYPIVVAPTTTPKIIHVLGPPFDFLVFLFYLDPFCPLKIVGHDLVLS